MLVFFERKAFTGAKGNAINCIMFISRPGNDVQKLGSVVIYFGRNICHVLCLLIIIFIECCKTGVIDFKNPQKESFWVYSCLLEKKIKKYCQLMSESLLSWKLGPELIGVLMAAPIVKPTQVAVES